MIPWSIVPFFSRPYHTHQATMGFLILVWWHLYSGLLSIFSWLFDNLNFNTCTPTPSLGYIISSTRIIIIYFFRTKNWSVYICCMYWGKIKARCDVNDVELSIRIQQLHHRQKLEVTFVLTLKELYCEFWSTHISYAWWERMNFPSRTCADYAKSLNKLTNDKCLAKINIAMCFRIASSMRLSHERKLMEPFCDRAWQYEMISQQLTFKYHLGGSMLIVNYIACVSVIFHRKATLAIHYFMY